MMMDFAQFAKTHDQGLELFIQQGYLLVDEDMEVRVRKSWNKAWAKGELTVKSGWGLMRGEQTMEIAWDVAEGLVNTCKYQLDKVRHVLDGRWEVDRYYDRHAGLVIMEIELTSPDEQVEIPAEFQPYLIREVTEEEVFKNKNLAMSPITPK